MLFSPHNPASTPTAALARSLGIEHPHSYQDLYHWSCTHPDLFWRNVALFDPPVIADALDTCVSLADPTASPDSNPQWFSGARLNWAENMLRQHNSPSAAGATALIQLSMLYFLSAGRACS
jgi:acetoacetyl-CoA synthetase